VTWYLSIDVYCEDTAVTWYLSVPVYCEDGTVAWDLSVPVYCKDDTVAWYLSVPVYCEDDTVAWYLPVPVYCEDDTVAWYLSVPVYPPTQRLIMLLKLTKMSQTKLWFMWDKDTLYPTKHHTSQCVSNQRHSCTQARWRWVVIFIPTTSSLGQSLKYSSDMKLGKTQNQYEWCRVETNLLPVAQPAFHFVRAQSTRLYSLGSYVSLASSKVITGPKFTIWAVSCSMTLLQLQQLRWQWL
jgi:hypothetical protein